MPEISSLVTKIAKDYPQFNFIATEGIDKWSYSDGTIYHNASQVHADVFLLHELAHALLGHRNYQKDIELLAMERDAWHHTKTVLGPHYGLSIDEKIIQESLDTYRDWIHAKSACPVCNQTGIEIKKHLYRCLSCSHQWHVNRGISTHIKRYSQTK
jgi:hypothetical protein